MPKLGETVLYTPHVEHTHLHGDWQERRRADPEAPPPAYPAIVGGVNDDDTVALHVLVPNREPHWQDNVPAHSGQADDPGHHTFRSLDAAPPRQSRSAPLRGDPRGGKH